jgi:hypothetical protein
MDSMITIPVVGVMMLGFMASLVEIAESTEDKAIAFADDMNNAMDCATRGIPIEVCSPNIMNHDFDVESDRLLEAVKEIESNITLSQLQSS